MSNQSLRILACDDDELLLELLRHRLTSKGYSVDTAMDGREALEKIRALAPDALVLDAMMPLVDGYEVLRQFRAMDGMQSVPVVFLSARKQEQDILTALSLGASDYLVKPFIPEELVMRLSRLLAKSQ
ncbi:response regulator [Sphingomonas sp. LY29]|uniref:response regulator transcription factor n=1 Tax=Sphingomonas sp. LY29 TaxID=3095341 RepID=UPI002D795630|nr:response regulator [Sphingomonas sp. LY29]WRP26336.1 response regulator [Sphingomonas sp. LY29]